MSAEQKHTPEPWRTGGTLGTLIVDASGHEVAAAQGVKDRHKIAARIVACVNYCAGVSDEELRGGRATDAIHISDMAEGAFREAKRREEMLLAALRDIAQDKATAYMGSYEAAQIARAAIAKVKP